MSNQADAHRELANDIGWRYYIQSLDDELAHIEDMLRAESLAFGIEHVLDDCACPGRRCPSCGQTKCYVCFNVSRGRKDGLQVYCRACRADWRKAHKKPVDSQAVEPVQQHATSDCTCPGKRCNYCKQVVCHGFFYKSAIVKCGLVGRCQMCISIVGKVQRDNDKAAFNAKDRARRQRVLQSEHAEIYRQNHREHRRRYERARGPVHTAIRRILKKQATGSFTSQEWETLKVRYNYACLCCGKREPEIKLTIDHVVPISKGGSNDASNIQPLCLSCNDRKHTKTIDYRVGGQL